jgi:hypothetical protein
VFHVDCSVAIEGRRVCLACLQQRHLYTQGDGKLERFRPAIGEILEQQPKGFTEMDGALEDGLRQMEKAHARLGWGSSSRTAFIRVFQSMVVSVLVCYVPSPLPLWWVWVLLVVLLGFFFWSGVVFSSSLRWKLW